MQNYIGYGFDTNDLKDSDWATLVKKYDPELYQEIQSEYSNEAPADAIIEETLDEYGVGEAEYLRIIININEAEAAGTNYIVSSYNEFVVFDNIRFVNDTLDSARIMYIKNESDFINMIGRYVPVENLCFGNLYEGSEWEDPVYWLD